MFAPNLSTGAAQCVTFLMATGLGKLTIHQSAVDAAEVLSERISQVGCCCDRSAPCGAQPLASCGKPILQANHTQATCRGCGSSSNLSLYSQDIAPTGPTPLTIEQRSQIVT